MTFSSRSLTSRVSLRGCQLMKDTLGTRLDEVARRRLLARIPHAAPAVLAAASLCMTACGADPGSAQEPAEGNQTVAQGMSQGKSVVNTRFGLATIKYDGGCTGTIIAPRHVLTAGHCAPNRLGSVQFYDSNGNPTSTANVLKIYRDALEFSDPGHDQPVDYRGYINDWKVLYLDRDVPSGNLIAQLTSSLVPVGTLVFQVGWLTGTGAMVFNQTSTKAEDNSGAGCPVPNPPAGQYCYGSVKADGADTPGDSGGPLYTLANDGSLIVHGDLLGGGGYTSSYEYFDRIMWATGLANIPGAALTGSVKSQSTLSDWRTCAALCRIDGSCAGYAHHASNNNCQLFSSVSYYITESGANTGIKSATGACSGDNCPVSSCQTGLGTGIPCGGGCPQCSNGVSCTQNSDCITNNCQSGVCAGGPAPSQPPAIFYGYDTDRRGSGNDWDYGHWKATCASSEAAVGVSKSNDNTFSHALLCMNVGSGATGTEKEILTFDPAHGADNRTYKRVADWDSSAVFEFECGLNEYVSGFSQNPNFYPPSSFFHAMRCTAGLGSATSCEKRVVQGGAGSSGAWGDWDYSFPKADCPNGKVMVGASIDIVKMRPHSIYCCNRGSTARYEAESATLTYYAKTADTSASQGNYVASTASSSGAKVTWAAVSSSAATSRTLEFAVRSPNGTTRKMGLWVNGTKLSTLVTTASSNWVTVSVSASLKKSSTNKVELRDSEGTTELDVDYLQITVPQ